MEVLTPDEADMELINRVIYRELCLGVVSQNAKKACLGIIDKLAQKGAQGVVLGCTEIGLLLQQKDVPLPVFDTAYIHAAKAAMQSIEPYDYGGPDPMEDGAVVKEES